MTETFGGKPAAATAKRTPKQAIQVGDQTRLKKPERGKVAIVDEEREVSVQVLYSTVTFRPGQQLKDARLLQIAQDNGIRLRYRE